MENEALIAVRTVARHLVILVIEGTSMDLRHATMENVVRSEGLRNVVQAENTMKSISTTKASLSSMRNGMRSGSIVILMRLVISFKP
jgi:hypothetical protein